MIARHYLGLGLLLLTSCTVQPTEVVTKPISSLETGCQFEVVQQSPVAVGRYQRVQFTYLSEAGDVPKRFAADILAFPKGSILAELLDQPALEKHETVPEAAAKRGAIAAINGGYYGEEFEPIGLYLLNGQLQQPISNESGLLTGVLSINTAGQIALDTRADFAPTDAVSAFQSGPFLIDPGNALGIYSDNGKLRKRTAVALSERGETIVTTTSPVSLYTLAQCLHTQPEAFGVDIVERALNLDGAISTGMYAKLESSTINKPEEVPVRSILLLYDK
ncbi:MAG: phosphodiester glycosidase family protein [Cyanobacteria bacterium J06629_9]